MYYVFEIICGILVACLETLEATTIHIYCRANQEWQWRYTLFTIAK